VLSDYNITRLRVSVISTPSKAYKTIGIKAGGKIHRLGDVCHVYRSYADPAAFKMRTMGQDAIGLAISMSRRANVTKLGNTLDSEFVRIRKQLPAEPRFISGQQSSGVVEKSIGEFMRALLEALAIVLAVSS